MQEGYYDDDLDDDDPTWEEHAKKAVQRAWDSIYIDDIRGVLEIPNHDEPRHRPKECRTIDDLRSVLEDIYTDEWNNYVPFDSGESVFTDDAEGYIDAFLANKQEIDEFFSSLRVENTAEELYRSDEGIKPGESQTLRLDVELINNELIQRLAQRPELMRELDPRKFEELIADLLRDRGYDVTLTPKSKDGGRDILAIRRDDIGTALTLVECKRYSQSNHVGVDIIRGLYGVVSAERATRGLIATTSFFTRDAHAFRDRVPYRLSFADFDVLRAMLLQFRKH